MNNNSFDKFSFLKKEISKPVVITIIAVELGVFLIALSLGMYQFLSIKPAEADTGIATYTSTALTINEYTLTSTTPVKKFTVDSSITFNADDAMVRYLLVDSEGNEHLVYENYTSVASSAVIATSDADCNETCSLSSVKPEKLRIQTQNATVILKKINSSVGGSKSAVDSATTKKNIINSQIKSINSKNLTWVAGETFLSKQSYEGKKKIIGIPKDQPLPDLQGLEYYTGGVFMLTKKMPATAKGAKASAFAFPDKWDWRAVHGANNPSSPYYSNMNGWLTSPRNQQSCGSCWAFAATAAVEAYVNLYYNQHINLDLSEQDLLSCSGGGSCSGGSPAPALGYIQNAGMVSDACFPYQNAQVPCGSKCATSAVTKIAAYQTIQSTTEDIKENLIKHGPLAVGILKLKHAMLLIGYKTVQNGDSICGYPSNPVQAGDSLIGKQYWIFKNSWGTGWGENGNGYANWILDASEFGEVNVIRGAPILSIVKNVKCLDADGDGYCNWGIGPKPASGCPSCGAAEDCNDSDPHIGPFVSAANLTCQVLP